MVCLDLEPFSWTLCARFHVYLCNDYAFFLSKPAYNSYILVNMIRKDLVRGEAGSDPNRSDRTYGLNGLLVNKETLLAIFVIS